MNRRLPRILLPGTVFFLLMNCDRPQPDERRSQAGSRLREAWDAANDPGLMLGGKLSYAQIAEPARLSGSVARPWSDSYWPLSEGGIARRWIDESAAAPFEISGDPHVESNAAYYEEANASLEQAIGAASGVRQRGYLYTWSVSPAEKYDIAAGNDDFALTRSELKSFVDNRRIYEKNDIPWGWMGHCHGWAEASVGLPAPRRAVLAQNRRTGEKVLFSAGDVRALVTKIASDNGTISGQRFAGTRCEDKNENIPRDRNQRIVDAALGFWDRENHSLKTAGLTSFRALFHSKFDGGSNSEYPYAVLVRLGNGADLLTNTPASEPIWVQGFSSLDDQREAYTPIIFSIMKADDGSIAPDMVLWASDASWIGRRIKADGSWVTGTDGAIYAEPALALGRFEAAVGSPLASLVARDGTKFAFKSFKECRDVNPATFHTALVRWLGEGGSNGGSSLGRGFVMDNNRSEQVWNQGVWRYRSRIGKMTPLQIRADSGQMLKDPFLDWRSEKAVTIADVETVIDYGVENGPMLAYGAGDETSSSVSLRYSLEFDEAGTLVGGEWHTARNDEPLSGAALLQDLQSSVDDRTAMWQEAPDFIWGNAAPDIKFRDSRTLRARVVEALLACSTSTAPDAGSFRWGAEGAPVLPYVNCPID